MARLICGFSIKRARGGPGRLLMVGSEGPPAAKGDSDPGRVPSASLCSSLTRSRCEHGSENEAGCHILHHLWGVGGADSNFGYRFHGSWGTRFLSLVLCGSRSAIKRPRDSSTDRWVPLPPAPKSQWVAPIALPCPTERPVSPTSTRIPKDRLPHAIAA